MAVTTPKLEPIPAHDATAAPQNAPSFPELLQRRAVTDRHRVAIRVDDDTLTYGAWNDASMALAHRLVIAFGRGRCVGLLYENAQCIDYAIAYLGTLRAGLTAVPLARSLSDHEIDAMCAGADVAAIVGATHGRRLTGADAMAIDDLPLTTGGFSPLPEIRPGDLAEILYTSGSTGSPKAVAVPHANLAGELALDELTHARPGIQLHAIPIGTNWAQFALRAALSVGVASVVMPTFDAARALELIRHHRPTQLLLVPPMALLLLAVASEPATGLESVRTIRLSAAPTATSTLEALRRLFPSATIHVGYSSTEASPACTMMEFPPDPPDTVGRAPEGCAVQVVDGSGQVLLPGRVGEVRLRASATPRRYLDEPEDDQPVFDGGWVRTGDLGYLDGSGYLRLRGRKSDVINVGGHKVFAPEVEAALVQHPAVVDVAVFSIGSDVLGEQVAAAVVLSSAVSISELRRFVRHRVAAYKVPAVFHTLDDLPRTVSGKASKQDLKRRFDRVARGGSCPHDADTIERELITLWSEILDADSIQVDDDLADHGAESLGAFAVLARLRERLDFSIPPSHFIVLSTIRAQAGMIENLRDR